ncbi:unnamed protein product [Haemonchus placei]|uniref:E2F transcription factor 6 n=1 Tax=Haemonchus placei TaxID=6290 RepID=A0A0N4WXQ8_HAEPC|nr:unnamed protein product [Haemonchus placei]
MNSAESDITAGTEPPVPSQADDQVEKMDQSGSAAPILRGPPSCTFSSAPLPVLEKLLFEDDDSGPELFDITDLVTIVPAQKLEELILSPDL